MDELLLQQSFAILLDGTLKATVFLIILLPLIFLLRKKYLLLSSSLCHAALMGLLLLPLAIVCIPSLEFPVETKASQVQEAANPAPPTGTPNVLYDEGVFWSAFHLYDQAIAKPRSGHSSPLLVEGLIEKNLPRSGRKQPNGEMLFVGVYIAGVLFSLLRLLNSALVIARLRKISHRVSAPVWRTRLDDWKERLGIRRPVDLVHSERVGAPFLTGYREPVIFLPGGKFKQYDSGQRDAVLIHELAHVKRGDVAWNIILRLVEALYWFHPLAWLFSRQVVTP